MPSATPNSELSVQPALPPGWKLLPIPARIDDLIATLLLLSQKSHWTFRGESRWFPTALPSLGRYLAIDAPSPLHAEQLLMQEFERRAAFSAPEPERRLMDNIFGVLIVMQHYGAPTRLLDWSFSPWVAAYHAASGDRGKSGFLWAFQLKSCWLGVDAAKLQAAMDAPLLNAKSSESASKFEGCPECVLPIGTGAYTERMAAQQGMFTVGHPARADHREYLGRAGVADPGSCLCLPIPAALKQCLMSVLSSMNITAATMFPGLDGVGRAMREIPENRIPMQL